MNNPASTILEFANRLDDISCINPLYTLRPAPASSKLANPPAKLPNPTTLHSLIDVITKGLCDSRLPLDPTLPLLQTPATTPLKPARPRASVTPLLPHADVPPAQPFPAFLSAQIEHLQRVSHYNYQILELTETDIITHPASEFCEELIALLPNRKLFKARFGVIQTSSEAIALISALKTAREAVIPVGAKVFVHTRSGYEKLKARNDTAVTKILCRMRVDNGYWYKKFRVGSCLAWMLILSWCLLVIGIGMWPDGRDVQRALLDSASILELGLVLAILSLGVGKEFWQRFGILVGWRSWRCEDDVIRDVGYCGRDTLVAGLFSGRLVDDVVNGFGIGEGGVRLREWGYDPRFGIILGEKSAFCIRGRRWYKVVKEDGKIVRYRLFPTGVRKAFAGITPGVRVVDGGKDKEVV